METVRIDSDRYYELYEEYLNQDGRTDMNGDLLYLQEFEKYQEGVIKFIN